VAKKKKTSQRRKQAKVSQFKGTFLNRKFLLIVILLLFLGLALYEIGYFFNRSTYFNIKNVSIIGDIDFKLSKIGPELENIYVGRNIFSVNLANASRMAEKKYPQFKKIEFQQKPPDNLEVNISIRVPVAVVDAGQGLVIDKESVVLSDSQRNEGLVKIKGVSFFLITPKVGEKVKTRVVIKALSLLELLRKRDIISRYSVDFIDISDQRNVLLCIKGAIVKMGKSDFERKIDRLKEILDDVNIKIDGIEYIDLRFEDAVISPR